MFFIFLRLHIAVAVVVVVVLLLTSNNFLCRLFFKKIIPKSQLVCMLAKLLACASQPPERTAGRTDRWGAITRSKKRTFRFRFFLVFHVGEEYANMLSFCGVFDIEKKEENFWRVLESKKFWFFRWWEIWTISQNIVFISIFFFTQFGPSLPYSSFGLISISKYEHDIC